jgi:hypothetical protein
MLRVSNLVGSQLDALEHPGVIAERLPLVQTPEQIQQALALYDTVFRLIHFGRYYPYVPIALAFHDHLFSRPHLATPERRAQREALVGLSEQTRWQEKVAQAKLIVQEYLSWEDPDLLSRLDVLLAGLSGQDQDLVLFETDVSYESMRTYRHREEIAEAKLLADRCQHRGSHWIYMDLEAYEALQGLLGRGVKLRDIGLCLADWRIYQERAELQRMAK